MSEVLKNGIDVSEWQREIDWPKVAAAGVEFAMIRATHGLKRDVYFERNIEGALDAGIAVGVYCCSYATSLSGVKAEAAYFLETILPYREEIIYPAAFDAEQEGQFRLGKAKVTELILTFCEAVTEAGYIPVNYTNCNWLNNAIDKSALAEAGVDVWVAWPQGVKSFADKPADGVTKHEHTMWQFSTVGRIDGINGNVDLNVSYIDYAADVQEEQEIPEGRYMSLAEAGEILAGLGCEGILL